MKFLKDGFPIMLFTGLAVAGIYITKDIIRRNDAQMAIDRAIERMSSVETRLPEMVIACNQTTDPIGCRMADGEEGKWGKILITYFSGDNENRKVYATQKVWIVDKPQIHVDQIEFH